MGHQSVIVVIDNFNSVGSFGVDGEIQKAIDMFQDAWKR
jgi:hypothetical protein